MSVFKILLHAAGRMGQKSFWIGIIIFALLYVLQIMVLRAVGQTLLGFFLALAGFCTTMYMLYCLFGKRLHDMGRSVWPLFGMFALLIVLAIILILQFGGMAYFDTLMANPDKHEDALWMQQQSEIYQQTLAENMGLARWLLWLPPGLLTLWCGLKPSQNRENRYGPPPGERADFT